jgi:hypothetical protein
VTDPDQGKFRKQGWGQDLPSNQPLAEEPGDIPAEFADVVDQRPFHQYLIAVGAVGETDKNKLARAFYETGIEFAHRLGVEPLLATGYVTESAQSPDYLDAAKVWHSLSDQDQARIELWTPRFHSALSLLFGKGR